MLCKFYWIVLYTVHFTAFSLGGPFFSGHGVLAQSSAKNSIRLLRTTLTTEDKLLVKIQF